jgi:hypothetical protein
MRYEPLLVACGQIAIWLSLLLIVSFYIRRRIGPRAAAIALPQLRAFWFAFVQGMKFS